MLGIRLNVLVLKCIYLDEKWKTTTIESLNFLIWGKF